MAQALALRGPRHWLSAGDPTASTKIALVVRRPVPPAKVPRETRILADTAQPQRGGQSNSTPTLLCTKDSRTTRSRPRPRPRPPGRGSPLRLSDGSEMGLGDLILVPRPHLCAADAAARQQQGEGPQLARPPTSPVHFAAPVDKAAPPLVLAALKSGQNRRDGFLDTLVRPALPRAATAARKAEVALWDAPDVVFVAVNADDDPSLVRRASDNRMEKRGLF